MRIAEVATRRRYPRAEPVVLPKYEPCSTPLGREEHPPTGEARGTLPVGFAGIARLNIPVKTPVEAHAQTPAIATRGT